MQPATTRLGFLYQVDGASSQHLYFLDPFGSSVQSAASAPLLNPDFQRQFQAAKHVAFLRFTPVENATHQALLKELSSIADLFTAEWKKFWNEEEVITYNDTLKTRLATALPDYKRFIDASENNPYRLLAHLAGLYIITMLKEEKTLEELAAAPPLKAEAEEQGKTIHYLLTFEDSISLFKDYLLLIFKTPLGYAYLHHLIHSPEMIGPVIQFLKTRSKAWEKGAVALYDHLKLAAFISPELNTKLEQTMFHLLRKRFPSLPTLIVEQSEHEKMLRSLLEQEMQPSMQKMDECEKHDRQIMAEKIASFMQSHPDSLIIASASDKEGLFPALFERNIVVQGPIRPGLKPRGFFWEIATKTNEVVGYLLGSIHGAPSWVLDTMNSRILKAFDSCNVLGVELDISKEDTSALNALPQTTKELLCQIIQVTLCSKGIETEMPNEDNFDRYIRNNCHQYPATCYAALGIPTGIDHYFIERAKKHRIVCLESNETHQAALAQQSSEFRTEAEAQHFVFQVAPELFQIGDTALIENLIGHETEEAEAAGKARNREMAESIHRLICEGNQPFGIAGAIHYTGEDGIQEVLRRKGYLVTQILHEEPY